MRKWLKDLREERNLTMKEMGMKLSISESYYCAIENGTRQKKMDMGMAALLATALGISIDTIAQHEAALTKQSAF